MRVLLVGEGSHSHGSFVRRLGERLAAREGVAVDGRVIQNPTGPALKLVVGWPHLGHFDLQPLRWRLQHSARARRALTSAERPDVALINTQSCALLCAGVMDRIPTVLSVDATGRQFSELEYWRRRGFGAGASEQPLEALERRAFRHAAGVLAWSEWTAQSLRDDYGVPEAKLAVVHPGVDVGWLDIERRTRPAGAPLQLLFVGNDAARKGLGLLRDALALVERPVELHVVSNDGDIEPSETVFVHNGLAAGDDALRLRFEQADVFALPTRADAVPWVLAEAMAAGLAVVASAVGAIPEMLGGAGVTVPPGDVTALAAAIRDLADDPARRLALGDRARERFSAAFEGERQLDRLIDALRAARESRAASPAT